MGWLGIGDWGLGLGLGLGKVSENILFLGALRLGPKATKTE